jgi:CRP/FNR family cyclic AMP-dependent transcriptional regulator
MVRLACSPSLLRSLAPFSSLSEAEFDAMLPSIQRRKYPARTRILRAGENSDGLYVILSGHVKVLLEDGEGRELIASAIGPNEFFGEAGLVDGGPRAASVQTLEACEVLFVPRKTILDLLQHNADAAVVVLRTVIDRLSDAHRKMASLALFDVYGRVARVLLEMGREASNGEWLVEPGSEQIAAMVGASREMVSRVVKDMIRRGVVRRHKRKLIVLDRKSLACRSARASQTAETVLNGSPPVTPI